MATAIERPELILKASMVKFAEAITAYLWMPEAKFPCVIGRINMDRTGRFIDGRLIRTAVVMSLYEEAGYVVAVTIANSRYVLVHDRGRADA
ncbi:hypothetical protein SFA35_12670 [Pseudomonas sp. HR96]|uniref:hypothetical protein n=1 Tax=Pseudomonas sp. HR96 TaxID=1027966 RepID=UPI002A7632C7|nr:hypothetical protein [Pseudomonas sp. HR96]WPO97531.1 hypothetical protein SFA35_12670 [Pseudomonas sp. HR96]